LKEKKEKLGNRKMTLVQGGAKPVQSNKTVSLLPLILSKTTSLKNAKKINIKLKQNEKLNKNVKSVD